MRYEIDRNCEGIENPDKNYKTFKKGSSGEVKKMLKGINCIYKGKISFNECLNCREKLCNLPRPYIWTCINNIHLFHYGLSPSNIVGCLKKAYLMYKKDLYIPLANLHWSSMRGSLVHGQLENYPEKDCVPEKQYSREYNGHLIKGTIDLTEFPHKLNYTEGTIFYDRKDATLWDYKTTKLIYEKYLPREDHINQVYIYLWIIQHIKEFKVRHIKICYLDMMRPYVVEIPMLSGKKLDKFFAEFVKPKVDILIDAYENDKEPEGRWADNLCDPKYCLVTDFCDLYKENFKKKKNGKSKEKTL